MARGSNTIRIGGIRADLRLGVAELVTDAKKATSTLKGIEDSFKSVQKLFSTALKVGGIVALTNGISKLASGLIDLADSGERAGSIKEAFDQLGGSSASIEEARKRVLGMVDSFDLMIDANKGLAAQIPGFEKSFANIADLGGRVANALGQDTKQAIDDLTDAIIRGNAKALKPLGFTFTDTKNKAQVTQQALAQLTGVMQNFAPVTDSVSNANQALNITFNEVIEKIGIALNASPQFTTALRELDDTISKINLSQFGQDLGTIAGELTHLAAEILPKAILGFHGLLMMAKDAKDSLSKNIAGSFTENIPGIGPLANLFGKLTGGGAKSTPGGDLKSLAGEGLLKIFEESFGQIENKGNQAAGKIGESIKKLWGAGLQNGADAANKKIDDLNQKLRDSIATDAVNDIKEKLSAALDAGNLQAAQGFFEDYKEAVNKLADEKVKEFDGADKELIARFRSGFIDHAVKPIADKMREETTKALEAAVQALQNFFSGISQTVHGIGDVFGIEIPAGLQRGLEIMNGIGNIAAGIVTTFKSFQTILDTINNWNNPGGLGDILGGIFGGGGGGGGGIIDSIIGGIGSVFGFSHGGVLSGPIVERAAGGKVVSSPTFFKSNAGLGLMGEAGPEAIMPLTKVNGRLGVAANYSRPSYFSGKSGSGITIHVDARGAEAGVESQVLFALQAMEDRIVHRSVEAVFDARSRGGF